MQQQAQGIPVLSGDRHPMCNISLEHFPFEKLHLRCESCFTLDGRHCLGCSHPSSGSFATTPTPRKEKGGKSTITPNAKTVSHPSLSDGDGNIEQLFNIIQNCGLQIIMNGVNLLELNATEIEKLFFLDSSHKSKSRAHYSERSIVLESLLLKQKHIDEEDCAKLMAFFTILNQQNESILENDENYQALKQKILYYDSRSRPTVFNNPKLNSNSINREDYEIDLSAKPDGVHYYFPGYLEIKGKKAKHLECLSQGIKRILASIASYGLFSKHLVFVVEKYFSFILFCDLENDCNPIIQVFLVSIKDLCSTMLLLNANILDDPSYYTHRHSLPILETFHSLNKKLFNNEMSLTYSQITKVAVSSSTIFKIIFNKNKVVDSMTNNAMIIKINENNDRFNTEKEVIIKMDEYYGAKGEDYFVIGYCDFKNSEVVLLNRSKHYCVATGDAIVDPVQIEINDPQEQSKGISAEDDVEITNSLSIISLKPENLENNMNKPALVRWFDGSYKFQTPYSTSSCGIIIMEEGRPLQEMTEEIYIRLLDSLRDLHEMRVLHRDLRSSNFIHFLQLNKYFVMDYDLSFVLPPDQYSTLTTIRKLSGQGERVPMKYRKQLKYKTSITVEWSYDDDVIMLCEYASSKNVKITYDK